MNAQAASKTRGAPSRSRSRWQGIGATPLALAVFFAGLGLVVCSLADALSRGTEPHAMVVYWTGVLLIALPIFYRLTSRSASLTERLLLVCLLGLSLYLVKVMRDAPSFTFNDELIHGFNANRIVESHHLFHENPVLKVTPYYPGLEGAASSLATMTGLSTYAAGTIVVGAARLVLVASLFFLFARVSGSARTAGLGAAIYAGNFNFFFYGAQFSYESLALPLLVLMMMMIAEREVSVPERLRAWAVPIVLAIAAIVVTHHLTSYAAAVVLAAIAIASYFVRRSWRPPNPWPFAIVAALLALIWLTVVASSTFGYLSSPLGNAVEAIANTIGGEAPPRGLFQSGANIASTPTVARALSLLAVALLTVAVPFGLVRVVRRYRRQPFAIIFALASIGFFLTLALRLAPAAWETGNRASEFFFIGLAFVVAVAGFESWRPRRFSAFVRPGIAVGLLVILVGGAIAGWPWDTQLAQPLKVAAGGGTITSQPLAMAEWAKREVVGGTFAAQTADGNLLLDPAGKKVYTGSSPDVEDILQDPTMPGWQVPLLRKYGIEYVVVDRREISADGIRGYYFTRDDESSPLYPIGVSTKFDGLPEFSRVYSNGAITVYRREEGR
ncbi:MAG: hypothetical protein JST31_00885 [Actinobacteria bacterium]|nr:hypothetical protein [Actinomycetota bacterium]